MLSFFTIISGASAANFNSSHSSSDVQTFLDDTSLDDDELVLDKGDYVDTLYNLNVSRNVNIKSNGQVNIKSSTGGTLFNVKAKDVQIINLNISGYSTAINSNFGGLSVIGCNISTNGDSINFNGSSLNNIVIENNSITYKSNGINAVTTGNNSIVSASIKGNNITINITTSEEDVNGIKFDCNCSNNALIFNNNNIELLAANNLTPTNNGTFAGIRINTRSNNNGAININNNNIIGIRYGVLVAIGGNNDTITITNNNIKTNPNRIPYKSLVGPSSDSGICFSSIYNNSILNIDNNVVNPGVALSGILLSGINITTITNNNIGSLIIRSTVPNSNTNITNNNLGYVNMLSPYVPQIPNISGYYSTNFNINNNNISQFILRVAGDQNINLVGNNITSAMDIYSADRLSGLAIINNTINSSRYGLEFVLDSVILSNITITGNTIFATKEGIIFRGYDSFIINQTTSINNSIINYNRILADVGLNFTGVTDLGSNFDYNWWGINDISDKIIGFDTNNHYILNITNLTSLNDFNSGDKVNFALLVLNTTGKNTGVENLPYFMINGTFNGIIYNTTTDDLFTDEFSLTNGLQSIDASLDEEYVNLTFTASNITENVTVSPGVNLTLSKVVNVTSVVNGQTVAYNITLANNGPDNATGVVVNEVLPDSLIYLSHAAGSGTYNPATGVWNIGNLANGANTTLVVTVRVNVTIKRDNVTENASYPNATNVYEVLKNYTDLIYEGLVYSDSIGYFDGYTTNMYATESIGWLNNGSDIENLVFNVSSGNNGLVYNFPDSGVFLLSFNISFYGGTYDPVTGIWSIDNWKSGERIGWGATYYYVRYNNGDTIVNGVKVTSDQPNINSESKNKYIIESITVTPGVNLTVTRVANGADDGQTSDYTITLTNNGPDNATDVVVNEILPDSLIYLSHVTGNGTYDSATGTWTIGNLANGETATLVISVLFNPTTNGDDVIVMNDINITANQSNINHETNDFNIIFGNSSSEESETDNQEEVSDEANTENSNDSKISGNSSSKELETDNQEEVSDEANTGNLNDSKISGNSSSKEIGSFTQAEINDLTQGINFNEERYEGPRIIAGNSVGARMKSTGLPFLGILLILLGIGGLISYRKK